MSRDPDDPVVDLEADGPGLGLPSPRDPSSALEPLRFGVTLPQFRADADLALEVAGRAEAAGLDGVFVFDHLWPLRQPERPALHSLSLLGAVAAETRRVVVGPLVARVGLLPDAVLVHALATLHRIAGARLIAGVGTGDSGNRDENLAYGVPFPPKARRLEQLAGVCARLRAAGIRTWVGGNSPEAIRLAAAWADGWNSWASDAATLAARGAGLPVDVTWGGQVLVGSSPGDAARRLDRHGPRPGLVHGTVEDVAATLAGIGDAGATWVVCAPLDIGSAPDSVDLLAQVAGKVRGAAHARR